MEQINCKRCRTELVTINPTRGFQCVVCTIESFQNLLEEIKKEYCWVDLNLEEEQ